MSIITNITNVCYKHNVCVVDKYCVSERECAMGPDEIYCQIGSRIKERRKQLKFKQKDLAANLGISRASLANVETGRQKVLVHQLYAYASALNLKPWDLMPLTGGFGLPSGADEIQFPADLKPAQKEQIARLLSGPLAHFSQRKDNS